MCTIHWICRVNTYLILLTISWYLYVDDFIRLIILIIKFEFQKLLHQKMAELFFGLIENKMIDSFKKRADEILD